MGASAFQEVWQESPSGQAPTGVHWAVGGEISSPHDNKPPTEAQQPTLCPWGWGGSGLVSHDWSVKKEPPEAEKTFQKRKKIKSQRKNIRWPILRRGRTLGRALPSQLLRGRREEDPQHVQWSQVSRFDSWLPISLALHH